MCFSLLGSCWGLAGEDDSVGILGRHERERLVADGRRQVPLQERNVLGLTFLVHSRYDELSRQPRLTLLDPDLPIDTFLPERVVIGQYATNPGGTDVKRRRDALHLGLVRAPGEQVREGDVDTETLANCIEERGDGRGRGSGCI